MVDLVVARLGTLEPRTLELLQLAGCVGHTFRLRTLSVIAEEEPSAVLRALLPAVMGGYLVPVGQNHRLLRRLTRRAARRVVDMSYRFAHDRIQHAALSMRDATERSRIHLRIGRLLLGATGKGQEGPSDDELFEVVTQLNLGRQHVEDPEERLRIAQLNLRAARRARSAAAHASAVQLAGNCLELLGERPFADDYEMSLNAHFIAAESHYLLHEEPRALELIDALSGGQAARASLARLLLSRYDVFLLDEPTNDLDLDGLERLERFVRVCAPVRCSSATTASSSRARSPASWSSTSRNAR